MQDFSRQLWWQNSAYYDLWSFIYKYLSHTCTSVLRQITVPGFIHFTDKMLTKIVVPQPMTICHITVVCIVFFFRKLRRV